MRTRSYHNTNLEEGETLDASESKAQYQEQIVLAFFWARPTRLFSPCDVQEHIPQWLLTSIRRAITNLTDDGYLNKTDQRKIGRYGKMVHLWALNTWED